jgi:hypothetical protein
MDRLLGLLLFAGASYYLIQRNVGHMIAWLVILYLIARKCADFSHTVSVMFGIAGIHVICMITKNTWEGFDNEKKEEKPEPASPKTSSPHVDVGTTILHAYRNLSPEQIGGMRRDTKELLGLQKELMGSLSEMKPAIEQGAELLKTFGTFFGKPGEDAMP